MNEQLHTLLKKYDIAGPRYTSYPTAPAWQEDIGPESFQNSLAALQDGDLLSLYIHIPFCENLCHFCGCMKMITTKHDVSGPYTQALLKEIDRIADIINTHKPQVSANQIHFGGGSPNFLHPSELEAIVKKIRERFVITGDAEIAIEMHPRTSTREFCEMVSQLGFNRISLGLQDLDPKVQKLINRHQTFEMTRDMLDLLRNLGLKSFNFDLIYGLPGQTLETWTKSLEQVISLKPDRLAVYSYAHIPWLKPYQRSFEDKDLPSPELKLQLFEKAYEAFKQAGYTPIGMDHFALPQDELARAHEDGSLHRNFMGYSTRKESHQIGFGVSSISFVDGNYFQNTKEIPIYEESVQKGQLTTNRGFILTTDDMIRRDLITKIMCVGRVKIKDFDQQWGITFRKYFENELEDLIPMIEDELVRLDDQEFKAINQGFLFLRNIAMHFDRYLQSIREKASNPVFSKTV